MLSSGKILGLSLKEMALFYSNNMPVFAYDFSYTVITLSSGAKEWEHDCGVFSYL